MFSPVLFTVLQVPGSPLQHFQVYVTLTHLPLDKMATILADDIFKCIFLSENDRISIQISLKLVPKSPIDNKLALAHVMAWHTWTCDKPVHWPMYVALGTLSKLSGRLNNRLPAYQKPVFLN